MSSSLWLLEAKAFTPAEERSAAAAQAQFWLRPGTYNVGRSAAHPQCDVECLDDNSISRQHATIEVPTLSEWQAQGNVPFVTIRDTSRYGTLVTADNDLHAADTRGITANAFDRWLVRFGNMSPFKLYNQAVSVCVHPEAPQSVHAAAAAVGLPEVSTLEAEGTLLVTARRDAEVDTLLLLGLLRGRIIVAASWLDAWATRKVWKGQGPSQVDHSVEVWCTDTQGQRHTIDPSQAAARVGLLAKTTLVWAQALKDDPLQEVTALVGATNRNAPGTKAAAKRVAARAVVVLPAPGEAAPAGLEGHRWTTPQLLRVGVVVGSADDMFMPAEASAATSGGTPSNRKAGPTQAASTPDSKRVAAAPAAAPQTAPAATLREGRPPWHPGHAQAAAAEPARSTEGTRKRKGPAAQQPADSQEHAPSKRPRAPQAAAQAGLGTGNAGPPLEAPPGWHRKGRTAAAADVVIGDSDDEVAEAPATAAPGAVVDDNNLVMVEQLLVSLPQASPSLPSQGDAAHAGPNFKAFRHKGDAPAPARPFALIPYEPEPYCQGTHVSEEYVQQERQRAQREQQADQLFEADLKPGKPGAKARAAGSRAKGRGRGK